MTGSVRPARLALLAAGLALAGAIPGAAQTARPYSLTLYDQPDYRGASVTFYGDNASVGSTGFAERARSAQVRGTWRLCQGGGYRNRCEVLDANVRDLEAYGLAGRVGSAQLLAGPPPQAERAAPAQAYAPQPYAPQPYPPQAETSREPRPRASSQPFPPPEPRGATIAQPNAPLPPPPYARAPGPEDEYEPPAVDAPSGPERYAAPPRPAAPPAPERYAEARRPVAPPAPAPPPPPPVQDRLEGRTAVFFARPTRSGADVPALSPRAADDFCREVGLGGAIYYDQGAQGRAAGDGPVLRDVLCRRY